MIFRQLIHDDLGCASYLVGDEDAAVAAVVDPRLDIEEYLLWLATWVCASSTPWRPTSTLTMSPAWRTSPRAEWIHGSRTASRSRSLESRREPPSGQADRRCDYAALTQPV
jgi:hypothetical protein